MLLCHNVHCYLLKSLRCLSVSHTVPSLGSVPICQLLSSTITPLSVSTSHCTVFWFNVTVQCCFLQSTVSISRRYVCWFFVTMFTAVFYSLSVLHTVLSVGSVSLSHCRLLKSLHGLLVPHIVPSVCSVSLCPLLLTIFPPMSVRTSNCSVCSFCVTMSTVVFYSLSTLSQHLTLNRLLSLCHSVHCSFLQSVHVLSVPHIILSVGSVNMTTAIWSLSVPHTVTFLVLCHYNHCCLLQSLHCLLVTQIVPSVFFLVTMFNVVCYSLSAVCLSICLSVCLSVPHTVPSNGSFHYVHCCLLQTLHSKSVPHNVPSVGSLTLYPLLSC